MPAQTHSGAPEDPFAMHLLDPGAAQMCTTEEGSALEVALDFACLPAGETDVKTSLAYAERVRKTFGSLERYLAWRDESNLLLDRPLPGGGTLHSQIALRDQAQRVFFYWVSWGYHQRGLSPDQTAALIMRGITAELRNAVSAAEAEIGAKIPVQGFCPRPQRDGARYLLGTMSEHGFGRAADIEPDLNPIVVGSVWQRIEGAVGRHVDRGRARWEHHADELYDDLDQMSAQWAVTVEAEVEAMAVTVGDEKARRAAAIQRLIGVPRKEALELAALPALRFLNHPRERVLALRDQGLVWGATFPNVDLHHFELAARPLGPWERTAVHRSPRRTDADFEERLER